MTVGEIITQARRWYDPGRTTMLVTADEEETVRETLWRAIQAAADRDDRSEVRRLRKIARACFNAPTGSIGLPAGLLVVMANEVTCGRKYDGSSEAYQRASVLGGLVTRAVAQLETVLAA